MSEYRRYYIKGGTWFFTVNLRNRRSQLLTTQYQMLRNAIIKRSIGLLSQQFPRRLILCLIWYRHNNCRNCLLV